MRKFWLGLIGAVFPVAAVMPSVVLAGEAERASVVKIEVVKSRQDIWRPWQNQEWRSSASGVVLEGGLILTNAHVVDYATQVFVQPEGMGIKYPADVVNVAPGLDLATVRLEPGQNAPTWRPATLAAAAPKPGHEVEVLGFPLGGTAVSATRGVLSRVEYEITRSSRTPSLRLQIDAAVTFGNSGGPVFADGVLVGLVFGMLLAQDTENIGYARPAEEIRAFLKDIEDGIYDGKPIFLRVRQTLENPALRAWLRLPDDLAGALVQEDSAMIDGYPLRPGDVLLRIGAYDIDNHGMTVVNGLGVGMNYALEQVAVRRDATVPLTIWRDGAMLTIEAPAQALKPLVMPNLGGQRRSYFIFGPLGFTVLSDEHFSTIFQHGADNIDNWAFHLQRNLGPLWLRRETPVEFDGEQLVILPSQPFAHRIMRGYDFHPPITVHSVNGVVIRNLRHLIETLRDDRSEFIEIEFAERWSDRLVFRRDEAIAATTEVLDANGIRRQCSDDLKDLWPELGQ